MVNFKLSTAANLAPGANISNAEHRDLCNQAMCLASARMCQRYLKTAPKIINALALAET